MMPELSSFDAMHSQPSSQYPDHGCRQTAYELTTRGGWSRQNRLPPLRQYTFGSEFLSSLREIGAYSVHDRWPLTKDSEACEVASRRAVAREHSFAVAADLAICAIGTAHRNDAGCPRVDQLRRRLAAFVLKGSVVVSAQHDVNRSKVWPSTVRFSVDANVESHLARLPKEVVIKPLRDVERVRLQCDGGKRLTAG